MIRTFFRARILNSQRKWRPSRWKRKEPWESTEHLHKQGPLVLSLGCVFQNRSILSVLLTSSSSTKSNGWNRVDDQQTCVGWQTGWWRSAWIFFFLSLQPLLPSGRAFSSQNRSLALLIVEIIYLYLQHFAMKEKLLVNATRNIVYTETNTFRYFSTSGKNECSSYHRPRNWRLVCPRWLVSPKRTARTRESNRNSCLFSPALLGYNWHITLYKFKVYHTLIWYIYKSQNDYSCSIS